jgi:hypothetical protein
MKTIQFDEDLKDLTDEEASAINGGESLWYWVAYGAGSVARDVVDYYEMWQNNPALAITITSYHVIAL